MITFPVRSTTKMKLIVSAFLCVFAFVRLPNVNGVTLCRPLSKFKVDCNICTCSDNGREYSCTTAICPLIPYEDKYNVVENEDGRLILSPKKSEQYVFDDNNNFELPDEKIRETRQKLPDMMDDEMYPPLNWRVDDPTNLAPDNQVDDERTFLDDQKDLEFEEWKRNEKSEDYVFDDDVSDPKRLIYVRKDVVN